MTNQDHNKILAILFYVFGGIQIFLGLLMGLVYGGMGTFFAVAGNEPEAAAVGGVVIVFAIFMFVIIAGIGGFYLFAGRKVQTGAPIGRILGIIASALALLSIPLGTAMGIYGLWFLIGENGKQFYEGGAKYSPAPPPPPNSWQ